MMKQLSADEVVQDVLKYQTFYDASGGGVTFSGGEATMQVDFLDEISKRLYNLGIDLAIETSGYFKYDELLPVLKRLSTLYIDLKHLDEASHKKWTGVSNQPILQVLSQVNELDCEIIVRIPLIKGVNDSEENIQATISWLEQHLPKAKLEFLPYHNLGIAKSSAMGLTYYEFSAPSQEHLSHLEELVKQSKIPLISER